MIWFTAILKAIGPVFDFIKKIIPVLLLLGIVYLYEELKHEKIHNEFLMTLHTADVHTGNLKDMKSAIDTMNLGIKTKNIHEVTNVTERTTTTIITKLRDSILTDSQHVQCINYTNGFTTLKGCFGSDSGVTDTHTDVLDIIIFKRPKNKFLFLKWNFSDTAIVKNKDPHSVYKMNIFRRDE